MPGSKQGKVLISDKLIDASSLRQALQEVTTYESEPYGVLRILSPDVRGHIGIESGRMITGAHVTHTREYGQAALIKLLSARRGIVVYISLSQRPIELTQSLTVEVDKLLAWRPAGWSEDYPTPPLEQAIQDILPAPVGKGAELSAFEQGLVASKLDEETEEQFAAYMAWGGDAPVLGKNLATLSHTLSSPKTSKEHDVAAEAVRKQVAADMQRLRESSSRPTLPQPTISDKPLGFSALRAASEMVARVTGRHKTLKQQTSESQTQKQQTQAITEELRRAASLGTDLTSARKILKERESKAREALARPASEQLEDDELEGTPEKASKTGKDVLIGGFIGLILLVNLGWQSIAALNYRDSVLAGRAAMSAGKVDIAIADFSTSIKFNPDNSDPYFYRALSEMKRGDLGAANTDFDEAIARSPKNPKLYVARGLLYLRAKEYDKSVGDCDMALSIDHVCFDAMRLRALALNFLGRYSEALSDSNVFLKNYKMNDKARANALSNRAYAYYKRREYALAIRDYSNAIDCDPDNGGLYFSRAVVYRQLHDWSHGVDDCHAVIKLLPGDAMIYRIRAMCYSGLGMSEEALRDLDKLVEFHPTLDSHLMRGDARLVVHDYEGAMADYDYVLAAQPHNKEVHDKYEQAKGSLAKTVKRPKVDEELVQQAEQAQQKPEVIDPNADEGTLVATGYQRLRAGNSAGAVAYLNAALSKRPDDKNARRYLAYALCESGRNSEAINEFANMARQQNLTNDDKLLLAKSLIADKRSSDSINLLSDLVSQDPKNDAARLELIQACLNTGNTAMAAKQAQEGMVHSPSQQSVFADVLKRTQAEQNKSAR